MKFKSVRNKILLGLGLLAMAPAFGQDVHFSQYYYSPIHMNPALTGVFDGTVRVGLNYRDQWANIGGGFQSFGGMVDFNLGKVGLGISAVNLTAGDGAEDLLNLQGGFSVDLANAGAKNHFILGLSGGIHQHALNGNKVILADGTSPASQSNMDLDFGLGALWFNGDNTAKVIPYLGAAVFHVNGPDNSFTGSGEVLPMRTTVHGGLRIQVGSALDIVPHGNFTVQGGARNIVAGMYASYTLNNFGNHFLLGANYRLNDAVAPYAGLKLGNVTAGFSYDFNVSDLTSIAQNASSLEFSLQYIIPSKKYKKVYTCPRL